MRKLITDKQLAYRLGWHPGTPAQLRHRGRMPFPYIKLGRNVWYYEDEVETILNGCKTTQERAQRCF